MGWDIYNSRGWAEAYKQVVHEAQVKVGGDTKAPDYCFRIGGRRKFFVEAKKPSVDIKHDVNPAYQLRRYAWSANLPLSIVTDFEEFAVYDCRIKPVSSDKASKARILYFYYTDYLKSWDEIAGIFAPDSIHKGSFDKYAESNKRKKGTAEVDAAFLEEIESWRKTLARNIALRNKHISQRDLNYAVQSTIDRIIFLRIAEDRGLEPQNQLRALISGDQTYPRLCHLFRNADDRYNSGLFHFKTETDRKDADHWTLKLTIDDKVLKHIFKRIYHPESPYEFSVLPADILGQVYEQFLGKVIRLKGKSAVVEEKPEVRKAGGVYYTPTYIVDYIVKHTVGELVEGKTANQVRGSGKGKAPIRILDPACGSGSFLLGAYQFLLDWYLEQYKQAPGKHLKGRTPRIFEAEAKPAPGETQLGSEYRLTTTERKSILLNHIYGVDIDAQAVEVTKLSLLLKVLEGENIETLNKNLTLFHERALPDLGKNIQCGNSLIGLDFYRGKQLDFNEDEVFRINAFDWDKAFPEVFKGECQDLWFVTFVTHNSRVSERMVEFGVTDSKGKGLQPLVFSPEEQIVVAESLFDTAKRHGFNFAAANVLPDHVHVLMPALDEGLLADRVRALKVFSAQAVNRRRGAPKGTHVWAQKFNRQSVCTGDEVSRITEYILANHQKHAERWDNRPRKAPVIDKGEQPLAVAKGQLAPDASLGEIWENSLQPLVAKWCVEPDAACAPPGGFDAVIGNPPYIRIQIMKETAPETVDYYKDRYIAASKGNYDIYVLFVERGLELIGSGGHLGFICPSKFTTTDYGAQLRELIARGRHLQRFVDFGHEQVFNNATTYTCLLFLQRQPTDSVDYLLTEPKALGQTRAYELIGANFFSAAPWILGGAKVSALLTRILSETYNFGDVMQNMSRGVSTGADNVFCLTGEEAEALGLELSSTRTAIFASSVRRYAFREDSSNKVIFPYIVDDENYRLLTHEEIESNFPIAYEYVKSHRDELAQRKTNSSWYGFSAPRNLHVHQSADILIPLLADNGSCCFSPLDSDQYCMMAGAGFSIRLKPHCRAFKAFFLAILNSTLAFWILRHLSNKFRGGWITCTKQYVSRIPLPASPETLNEDPFVQDLTKLVDRLTGLRLGLSDCQSSHSQSVLQRQIEATDAEINRLVYELYGLTENEIRIVEEATQ